MNNVKKTEHSNIWEATTSEGTFRVLFPCGVFTKEHIFYSVLEAFKKFDFLPTPVDATKSEKLKIADNNASALQKSLNDALCCGTYLPQGKVTVNWLKKEVYVM